MKMTKKHYNEILNRFKALDKKHDLQAVYKQYKNNDLSDKRFAWDMFRAVGGIEFTTGTLYAYLEDVHINTALRKCLKDIGLTK